VTHLGDRQGDTGEVIDKHVSMPTKRGAFAPESKVPKTRSVLLLSPGRSVP
jgi:hypothetical protein